MKKKLATAIFTVAATLAFADEPTQTISIPANTLSVEKKAVPMEKVANASSKSYTYLRMGVTDTYPANSVQIVPGLGLGYRLATGDGALDLSANYTQGRGYNGKENAYFYTLPKAAYIHYLAPQSNNSVYAGAGMAFGGMKNKEGTRFVGLIPNVAFGYEMNRNANFRTFLQLDVSQPAIAADLRREEGRSFPGPIAELSLGAGF